MTPAAVTRTQTGVRLEANTLKVLKALAGLKGMTLGDLLEGVVLHAFDGEPAFGPSTLAQIAELKKIYGLELTAADAHKLIEVEQHPPATEPATQRAAAGERTAGR